MFISRPFAVSRPWAMRAFWLAVHLRDDAVCPAKSSREKARIGSPTSWELEHDGQIEVRGVASSSDYPHALVTCHCVERVQNPTKSEYTRGALYGLAAVCIWAAFIVVSRLGV